MGKTQEKDQEQVLLENALRWVNVQMIEGEVEKCPFCSWTPSAGASPDAMEKHLTERHQFTLLVAYQQKSLNPELRTDEELEVIEEEKDFLSKAGIEMQEDLDRPDYLFLPSSVKRDIAQRGGARRWVRGGRRLEMVLARGAVLVERPADAEGLSQQGSTEDTKIRSNEMFLIEWPAEKAALMRRQKEARVEQELQARAEDLIHLQTKAEKLVYDAMISMNYDKEVAAQVSKAAAKGEGNWQAGSDRAHGGLTIQDRKGTVHV